MYLSRVELNPYRRETMRALRSPEIMHAAVMASFPSSASGGDRILWRIDRVGAATYLLVQSARKPDFHHIVDQFGRPECDSAWDCLDYDGFLSKIENGQVWRFRLAANPVHSVMDPEHREGARGKVCGHVTAEQQTKWLLDRCGKHGFSIVGSEEEPNVRIVFREVSKFRRGDAQVTINRAVFEGVLRVEDADALRLAMSGGIGKAKAYGCGLLTLAR
ncbi:type I-E CRISPR-associated protein Cas6/Cse3/CasE [Methanomassiliicoccales archaeon LGM-DZ1]|jgi:CRISPR system Cascade subunit CasE|nr:type I-E CRISPR-associated protein Cas6/Cse3/CasE [Methanomassiliicoccales archaeon LGM-DZ1]